MRGLLAFLIACSGSSPSGDGPAGDDDDSDSDTAAVVEDLFRVDGVDDCCQATLTGAEACPVPLGAITLHNLSPDVEGTYSLRCDYVDPGTGGKAVPAVTFLPDGGSRELVRIDDEVLAPATDLTVQVSHFCSVDPPFTTTCTLEAGVGLDGERRLFTVDVSQ